MIISLNHVSDFENEERLVEIIIKNDTLKGLVHENKKRSNSKSFARTTKDVKASVKGLSTILSKSNPINSEIHHMEELEKKKN